MKFLKTETKGIEMNATNALKQRGVCTRARSARRIVVKAVLTPPAGKAKPLGLFSFSQEAPLKSNALRMEVGTGRSRSALEQTSAFTSREREALFDEDKFMLEESAWISSKILNEAKYYTGM